MMFNKPATALPDQIAQLKSRGLIIKNESLATHWLGQISYYRLAGYWWPMQSEPKSAHIFKPNSHFENVVKLYKFDAELRALLFQVIEKIEVAFRAKLIYHMSHEFNPWWFEDPNLFTDASMHANTLTNIKSELARNKKKETFLKEHYRKYHTDLRCPPAWKTLEIASLGTLSKIYGNLKNTCLSKDLIAAELGTANHTFLHSWMQAIAQIRNVCAHHGRLWNKNLPSTVKLLPRPPFPWVKSVPQPSEFHMLYTHLCCMKYLFNVIDPGNNFTFRLFVLLKKYPNVDPKALGLHEGWMKERLWNNKMFIDNLFYPFFFKVVYMFRHYVG